MQTLIGLVPRSLRPGWQEVLAQLQNALARVPASFRWRVTPPGLVVVTNRLFQSLDLTSEVTEIRRPEVQIKGLEKEDLLPF